MAKSFTGVVSSDKADKTIVVTVVTRKTHPIYKKQYSVNAKFMAHDETNEAKIGDRVIVEETRPISARKHFKLIKVLERATIRHEETSSEVDEIISKETKSNKPKATPKKDESMEEKS